MECLFFLEPTLEEPEVEKEEFPEPEVDVVGEGFP